MHDNLFNTRLICGHRTHPT